MNLQIIETNSSEYITMVDMGLIWQLAAPTAEDREEKKRDGRDYQWYDYLEKMCSVLLSRHPNAVSMFLFNDDYKKPYSIKDEEQDRRSSKYTGAGNKFPKPHDSFPGPTEFSAFLSDSGNKTRLQHMIKRHLIQKNFNTQIIYR